MEFHVEQWPKSPWDGKGSCQSNRREFDTEFQPLAIRQNEIAARNVPLKKSLYDAGVRDERGGGFSFPVSDENIRLGEYSIGICLSFEISTPSVATKQIFVEVSKYVLRNQPGQFILRADSRRSIFRGESKPDVLLRRFGSIFND